MAWNPTGHETLNHARQHPLYHFLPSACTSFTLLSHPHVPLFASSTLSVLKIYIMSSNWGLPGYGWTPSTPPRHVQWDYSRCVGYTLPNAYTRTRDNHNICELLQPKEVSNEGAGANPPCRWGGRTRTV
jgi:hypothetical protein